MPKLTEKELLCLRCLSPFEQKVLLACAKIPKGHVRTYAQVAREIGKPHAARAVGNALAKNPLAPHIPCHRVVRSDGKIGDYSGKGGKKAKEMMLNEEGAGFGKGKKFGVGYRECGSKPLGICENKEDAS